MEARQSRSKTTSLYRLWLQEHQAKLLELGTTINDVLGRFEDFGEEMQERIQSDEYLGLVRRAFRSWDEADTQQKREHIKRVLTNAGGTKLCSDDTIRLFSLSGSTPTMNPTSQL